MKHPIFIVVCFFSSALLHAAPFEFECPCKQPPKPPKPVSQFYQVLFGCGCNGESEETDEIPPYQDYELILNKGHNHSVS